MPGTAFPLLRTVAPLRERAFDLLVIGGGIYGAWTAYDAALRGLAVALIEKHDWASGTSSASSKLIHGGLRYLEHYDFALVVDALAERRRLHRLAPHLVRPLNFVMPVWKGPRASMFMLASGLLLYDLLGRPHSPVPWHRRYSRAELLRAFPAVDPERLLGGFRYGDCQEDDARMTLTVVAAAQSAGALVANRVEAEALLGDEARVQGARVRDRVNGAVFEVRARAVVNAAGPWAAPLLGAQAPRRKLVKGTHLILPAIPGCTDAFLLTAQDGRVFFVIPWYGRTLVGTTEEQVGDAEHAQPTDADVRYLLAGVKNGLPGLGWTESDVIARFAGVRTLQAEEAASLAAVTREFDIEVPRPGLILPLGGKFTTARVDAAQLVDRVQKDLDVPRTRSLTATRPLPGTPETGEPFERWQQAMTPLLQRLGVDADSALALTLRHGTGIGRVAELLREEPRWARRLVPGLPFVAAEAVLAVRDEMALSLDDVLRRRIPLLLLERLTPAWLRELAQTLGLEWQRDPVEILHEFRPFRAEAAFQ